MISHLPQSVYFHNFIEVTYRIQIEHVGVAKKGAIGTNALKISNPQNYKYLLRNSALHILHFELDSELGTERTWNIS